MFKYAPHALLALVYVAGNAGTAFAQSQVKPNPNHVKYANSGPKPSTGRSGSATLEARALIAKDGSMLVEASTGAVASGSGPGSIAKVQVKVAALTKNFNNLTGGGYWSGGFAAPAPGTAVQVQTNVRDIDPKRTGVVTVSTPALRRPDVAVTGVAGPAQAAPQSAVTFIADVQEMNGDVGATANCVLSINGTQADVATGIWIDAGDAVNCQFSYTFTQPGTYTVTVDATGVTPGDWDEANNSGQTTITIIEPNRKLNNGSLYAEELHQQWNQSWYRDSYYYYYYYGYYEWGYNSHTYNRNYVNFNGSHTGGAPVMQTLATKLYRNGSLQATAALSPNYVSNYDSADYYNNCAEYYNEYWNGSTYVHSGDRAWMCSWGSKSDPNSGHTSVWYQKLSGTVTYYGSYNYCYYYYYWCGGGWSWNAYVYGNGGTYGWAPGDEIRLTVDFTDNSGVSHTADKAVVLANESSSVNYSYGYGYWDWYWGYYSYYVNSSGTLYRGHTWWNDPQ